MYTQNVGSFNRTHIEVTRGHYSEGLMCHVDLSEKHENISRTLARHVTWSILANKTKVQQRPLPVRCDVCLLWDDGIDFEKSMKEITRAIVLGISDASHRTKRKLHINLYVPPAIWNHPNGKIGHNLDYGKNLFHAVQDSIYENAPAFQAPRLTVTEPVTSPTPEVEPLAEPPQPPANTSLPNYRGIMGIRFLACLRQALRH